jgi:hypothetical protein
VVPADQEMCAASEATRLSHEVPLPRLETRWSQPFWELQVLLSKCLTIMANTPWNVGYRQTDEGITFLPSTFED